MENMTEDRSEGLLIQRTGLVHETPREEVCLCEASKETKKIRVTLWEDTNDGDGDGEDHTEQREADNTPAELKRPPRHGEQLDQTMKQGTIELSIRIQRILKRAARECVRFIRRRNPT